jgi:long-chain acyl-CoA synthetase
MLYADPFHNCCVALVVPARQTLEKWAQDSGINFKDIGELCLNDQAINEVQQSLSKARYY